MNILLKTEEDLDHSPRQNKYWYACVYSLISFQELSSLLYIHISFENLLFFRKLTLDHRKQPLLILLLRWNMAWKAWIAMVDVVQSVVAKHKNAWYVCDVLLWKLTCVLKISVCKVLVCILLQVLKWHLLWNFLIQKL